MTNHQLKAHCEDVIANPQDHLDWVVDMARVALASLEAEAVYQVQLDDAWVDLSEGAMRSQLRHGATARTIYTAPPAPELKINRIKKLAAEIVENFVDCSGADEEAVEQYTAWVIQRLNGVKS